MSGRTYKANGEAIESRRKTFKLNSWDLKILRRSEDDDVGLTNRELATLMCSPKVDDIESTVRSIGRAKAGDRRERDSLMLIALALRMEFDETWVPDDEDKVENLIDDMKRFDQSGNFAKARGIGLHLLNRSKNGLNHTERGEVIVRLAMVYDHDRNWKEALRLLENIDESLGTNHESYLWARYQRGLIQRVFAEDLLARRRGHESGEFITTLLEGAREDLDYVADTEVRGLDVAAHHQLAVLLMIDDEFEQALAMLDGCLKQREEAPAESEERALFRQAYEHRRIGQCHAFLGSMEEARDSFELAATLAKQSEHQRLLLELTRDLEAWDLIDRVPVELLTIDNALPITTAT
jgi:tetratricopeptide (TPR) repeat protein